MLACALYVHKLAQLSFLSVASRVLQRHLSTVVAEAEVAPIVNHTFLNGFQILQVSDHVEAFLACNSFSGSLLGRSWWGWQARAILFTCGAFSNKSGFDSVEKLRLWVNL